LHKIDDNNQLLVRCELSLHGERLPQKRHRQVLAQVGAQLGERRGTTGAQG